MRSASPASADATSRAPSPRPEQRASAGGSAQFAAAKAPPVHWGLRKLKPATPGEPRTVGVVAPHYNLERLSYLLPVPGYRFVTVRRLPLHKLEKRGTFWANTSLLLDRSLPLIHTWNLLPINARRFIVSFELELPRYLGTPRRWQMATGLRLLSSDRCAAILGLSEVASRRARQRLTAAGHADAAAKIKTFRGGVAPAPDHPSDGAANQRATTGPIRFLFVGADGIRKGLIPTLDALEELRAGGIDLRLTIVSEIQPSRFIENGDPAAIADAVRQRAQSLEWIDYRQGMPNAQVRALMRTHDLLLFPTFNESLGWVVIEAGMEALPAITSNVFAIPELVDDAITGRVVQLPLSTESRWEGLLLEGDALRQAVAQGNRIIRGGLIQTLSQVAANRDLPRQWGEAARQKMLREYHPNHAAAQLKQHYDAALD